MKKSYNNELPEKIKDIIFLENDQFIEAAFNIFLGRSADPQAMDHYNKQLLKNNDRMKLLSDVLNSKEAILRSQDIELVNAIENYNKRKIWKIFTKKNKDIPKSYVQKSEIDADLVDSIKRDIINHLDHFRNDQSHISSALLHQLNRVSITIQRMEYRAENVPLTGRRQHLGGENTRFLVNLSTSNHWRSHAVGIVRVERELARYLKSFENVDFVLWHNGSGSLRILTPFHVKQILSDAWCEGNDGLSSFDPETLPSASLTPDDIYVSLGLDWDHAPTSHVLAYLRQYGVKSILACYDLVPINFPEFLVREELGQEFRQHLLEMAHGASKVFVISEASKRDLLKFWEEADLAINLPEVFVVPLASYAALTKLPPLNEHEKSVMRDVFRKGEYILYVSSFEPRKNYKLALDLWRDLWRERGRDCPQFVHVGMTGWGSHDLLNRIPRMAAYVGGKINGLQRVSDNLLAHLYANCTFTIFPSLYEGWGLAATESLSFGKVCVVASNSSLQEATQNLMPSYHPLDFLSWKKEINHLLDDDEYRKNLENSIKENYIHQGWEDFGKMFSENITLDKVV